MFDVIALPAAPCSRGIILIVVGSRRVESTGRRAPRTVVWSRVAARANRWGLARTIGVVVAGRAATASARPVLIVVIPLLVLGLPALLSTPQNRDLALLEALDRWVRLLAATLATGVSIPDAIRTTRRQVPTILSEPVALLVARIDDGGSVRQALSATADDLASPDADAVLAALIPAAERGGTGAVATLQALADSISDRLKAGREIEAERAKPRIVVRQVTVLTLGILGAAFCWAETFLRPVRHVVRADHLGVPPAAYVGLVWLRRLTAPRTRERILQ